MYVCWFVNESHSLSEKQQEGMLQFMFDLIITSLESCCRGCHVLTFVTVIWGGGRVGMYCSHQSQTCPLLLTDSCFCLSSLHWSFAAIQMTTQDLLLCKYSQLLSTLIGLKVIFPQNSYLLCCFSGRAILMQITKTRMWGKGILTRCWKR